MHLRVGIHPTAMGTFCEARNCNETHPRLAVDRDVTGDFERDFNLPPDERYTHKENVDPTWRGPGMSGMSPATLTALSSSNGALWHAIPVPGRTEVVCDGLLSFRHFCHLSCSALSDVRDCHSPL